MIGSPDLVAFTKEPEFKEVTIDPLALPEELSVPTYTNDSTPWSKISIAKFKKDFILLSEFSEQVGPQPLLTVPHETKACGTFDLNHFSLRIMSVDYQTSLTSSGTNSSKLNFVEDSRVVLGDSKEGAFAYIHHLTLYDLEARGFVRPFCIAYVASDENKIIQQFQQLSSEFSKVSECLKTGNRKNFANELETKLRDLEYTRHVLLREIKGENVNKYTNEREWTLNGIPILEGDQEDGKQKEKSLLPKREVKAHEEDGCGHSNDKAETRNCTLKLKTENLSNNRSIMGINNQVEEITHTYDRKEQSEEQWKDKQKKEYCSIPLANVTEELINVERSIQEHKNLLKQVTSYPTRKLRDSEFSPYEPDDLPHSLEPDLDESRLHGQPVEPVPESNVVFNMNTPLHSPKLINTTLCRRFDRRLKTLEELCDEYFHKQALQQMHIIEKTFRGDASHIYANHLCHNLLRNLKLTNFLFEDTYNLKEAAGLQPANISSIHRASFLPAPTILSEPVSLESYASCVEMVPIKLELGGASQSVTLPSTLNCSSDNIIPPSPEGSPVQAEIDAGEVSTTDCSNSQDAEYVSDIMKSSISSGDSIEVLGTEKSFRSQSSHIPCNSSLSNPPPIYTTTAPEGVRQGRVPTKRTFSEDSIEVLCTADSILPEDLRALYPCAINEESPEQETDEKDISENQKDKQVRCVHGVRNGCCVEVPQGYPTVTLTPPDPPTTFQSQDEGHTSHTPLSLLEEPCRTLRDDLSDCFSLRSTTASDGTFCNYVQGDKRECVSRQRCGKVGRAALKFLRQFPFAPHAVFSLLSGRTLVVLGTEEAKVRQLVTALSVYIPHPGRYRENVQPWISTPLQLTDLLNWKLVGFNRMCSPTPNLPHCLGHYSRYISVLDADQKTLRCPTYSGTLINQLMDPRSHIIRGNTYYLFAQGVLGKLVAKAFLLTFSHTLNFSKSSCESKQRMCFYEELHGDDKKILHYLSEFIKLHFTEVQPNVLRFSYNASSVFKL